MEWPRSAFERVHEEVGDVMSASWDHNLVSFVTSDCNMGKGVLRRFKERYQGTEELKAQSQDLGGMAYLINTMAAPTSNGVETKQRYICYLLAQEPLELAGRQDLYSSACKLTDLLLGEKRVKVAAPYMPTYKWDDMEKILEYVFKDTTIDICVYRFKRHRQDKKKKTIVPENQKQAQRSKMSSRKNHFGRETVDVSGDGQSYADLVGGLRNDVDLKGVNIELAKVRKTQRGEVLLEIKQGSVDALRSAINTQLKTGWAAKRTRHRLRGLDSLTT
nr:unnamed protein product [Callosobruchus analis]